MSAVTVGIVAPAAAVVGRALARLRVRERARGRGDEDVARGERRGDRRRGSTPWFSRSDMTASTASAWRPGLAAQRLPHVLQRLVDHDEHVLAGATARQVRTTVRTARASPVILGRY
jgi:hypothetical protein